MNRARQAHTLVELLLVVVLLLGLLSAVIINIRPTNNQLSDGVVQLRSLIIYARSMAQINGRIVRVEFHENEPITVRQQTNPLDPLSTYTDLPEGEAYTEALNELVVIVSEAGLGDDSPQPVLICYPDGTTELQAAPLTVVARDGSNQQRATVSQSGPTTHVSQP